MTLSTLITFTLTLTTSTTMPALSQPIPVFALTPTTLTIFMTTPASNLIIPTLFCKQGHSIDLVTSSALHPKVRLVIGKDYSNKKSDIIGKLLKAESKKKNLTNCYIVIFDVDLI